MLSELIVDGNAVTTASSYTFENVTSNHTITATFSPIRYTIKYNGNGATSGSMSDSSHTYGVAKTLTTNSFSRTGYNFLGWSTSSSIATVTYTDGQSVSNLTTTNGATVNLYAVWGETLVLTTPTGSPVSTTEISVSISGTLGSGSGDIIYKLYVGGTYKSTVTGASGNKVTLNATGLTANTTYSCYVVATSKINSAVTATSSTVSVKTYTCDGTGTTCSGPNASVISSCPGPDTGHTGMFGFKAISLASVSSWTCSNCGNECTSESAYGCNCGALIQYSCTNCGYSYVSFNSPIIHTDTLCYSNMCTACDGGIQGSSAENPTYYCKHGYTSSHSICSHGYCTPHN